MWSQNTSLNPESKCKQIFRAKQNWFGNISWCELFNKQQVIKGILDNNPEMTEEEAKNYIGSYSSESIVEKMGEDFKEECIKFVLWD
jgi:hypothetical protein